jgi:hypothetical protein
MNIQSYTLKLLELPSPVTRRVLSGRRKQGYLRWFRLPSANDRVEALFFRFKSGTKWFRGQLCLLA